MLGDLLTFHKSEVISIVDFFRLKGFRLRHFLLSFRWVHYLPRLISRYFAMACFCFNTSMNCFDRSSFFKFFYFFFIFFFVLQVV